MFRIHDSVIIARPREIVFDFAADQRNEPSYNPAMLECTKLTDGPIGAGTTFSAVMAGRGRQLRMTSELTAVDRPRLLESRTTTAGAEVVGSLTFDPYDDETHTRMTWDWQIRLDGWMRLGAPMIWLLGPRTERRIWSGLKARLEAS